MVAIILTILVVWWYVRSSYDSDVCQNIVYEDKFDRLTLQHLAKHKDRLLKKYDIDGAIIKVSKDDAIFARKTFERYGITNFSLSVS